MNSSGPFEYKIYVYSGKKELVEADFGILGALGILRIPEDFGLVFLGGFLFFFKKKLDLK